MLMAIGLEDRIQVTFPKGVIQAFKGILVEGILYGLKKFRLANNIGKYRITSSKYKIQVGEETQLRVLFESTFPTQRFWFKSVIDVLRITDADEDATFDVMGVLVEVSLPQNQKTYRGDLKKMMNIYLEDIELNRLCCTLWDDYIDMFMKMREEQTEFSKIVIVQYCKANIYHDKRKIANILHATKLYINAEFDEVTEYRMRYVNKFGTGSASCSVLSGGTQASFGESYVEGVTVGKKIVDLFMEDENAYCWIGGTVEFVDFDGGWNYVACSKCYKKLDKMDKQFYCRFCSDFDSSPTLRYKLKIRVKDDTGIVSLLLWDSDYYHIIGKTAAEIAQISGEGGFGDPEGEIELNLLRRNLIFKIQLRSENVVVIGGRYSVAKVMFSSKPVPSFAESQESKCLAKNQVVDGTLMNTPSSKEGNPIPEMPSAIAFVNDLLKPANLWMLHSMFCGVFIQIRL